jgi:hypothetical protein
MATESKQHTPLIEARVQVKVGWYQEGREGIILTDKFHCDGLDWVVVSWLDDQSEEGLEIFKLNALEVIG